MKFMKQPEKTGRLASLSSSAKNVKISSTVSKLKKYFVTVVYPDELTSTFDDLIGMENEKEILQDALNFLKNIEFYQQNPVLIPHTRYLLGGEPGSGKTILINALAKTAQVPIITMSMSSFVAFSKDVKHILNLIFDLAASMQNGCVLLFNDFAAVQGLSAELLMFFHNQFISRVCSTPNNIILLSSSTGAFELPAFYFENNAFSQNKTIMMQPPTLQTRQKLIEAYFKKFELPLADDVSAEQLARNTLGMYPKDLEYIIRETALHASRKGELLVTAKDFNDVMLTMEAGQMYNKLSEKERISTAYHEAGHVIAAYYSNPNYVLGRVEITPRAASLGLTQEDAGEEKHCLFKHDFEYNIIYSLGGMAAEKLIYGETSSGVHSDLRSANMSAIIMYQNLGMSEELGPVIYDDDEGLTSDRLWHESEVFIQKEIKRLYDVTFKIVSSHKAQLEALTQALLKREVLMGPEIKAVLDKADLAEGIVPRDYVRK